MDANTPHTKASSLDLVSKATREAFYTDKDLVRAYFVTTRVTNLEQTLETIMSDATEDALESVHARSTSASKPDVPRIVSAELYARQLILSLGYKFRLKTRTQMAFPSKLRPLSQANWFNEPLSPEHRKMVAELTQKAEATKKQPKHPVAHSDPSTKSEVSSSAGQARGSQLHVSPAMTPPPTSRIEPAQPPAQGAPAASQPSPQNGSEGRPFGSRYRIPCSFMDEEVTLQVWKDHLQPLAGIHGSGLAWHVVVPAAKSHLFFGEKGSQIKQVVESCTPPAHITAEITEVNGDEVLLIAIYAQIRLWARDRECGLEVAMLQMFDAIYAWSTKIHGGEDLSFVDFMRSRKQRLLREAVNATLSTVAKAAHDLSVRTSQAMQDDTEQQERAKRRRLDS